MLSTCHQSCKHVERVRKFQVRICLKNEILLPFLNWALKYLVAELGQFGRKVWSSLIFEIEKQKSPSEVNNQPSGKPGKPPFYSIYHVSANEKKYQGSTTKSGSLKTRKMTLVDKHNATTEKLTNHILLKFIKNTPYNDGKIFQIVWVYFTRNL